MDLGCKYIDYEPEEKCRCYLLGYFFSCGSKECLEAKNNELADSCTNPVIDNRGR